MRAKGAATSAHAFNRSRDIAIEPGQVLDARKTVGVEDDTIVMVSIHDFAPTLASLIRVR